jgi:RNA polymerase sigma factor (sigma-70 family)
MARDRSDDEEAFRDAFRVNLDDVYRYVLRRARAADTDAVVGEVFLIAWRQWPVRPSRRDEVRPWLFGIARNTLRSTERREIQRFERELRSELPHVSEDVSNAIVEQMHNAEQSAHMRITLSCLSENDQEILKLAAWEELDTAAIAIALNVSSATARVRLHRARRRLEAVLSAPSNAMVTIPRKATR